MLIINFLLQKKEKRIAKFYFSDSPGQQEMTGACPAVNHASLYKNALGRVLRRAFLAAVIMLCEPCPPTRRVGGFYGVSFLVARGFKVAEGFRIGG